MAVHCNNEQCLFYVANQTCSADDVFYVDRVCVTFRHRPRDEDYRDLMRPNAGICHREKGRLKRYGR